jgi:hypothetical protein
MMIGSCLCGAVHFQIDGVLERMTHCHCSMCRKTHGAAFATYATCSAAQFLWTRGEDSIAHRESSPGFTRSFCRHCSSSLPSISKRGVHVPVGCLDGDPQCTVQMHTFCESAAPWHVIADELPRHDTWDDERTSVQMSQTALGLAPNKTLRGSCLCGAVGFEVVEPFDRAHNCHCSRCRKSRAAAHASNAFTSIDGVRFTHGEDHIDVFKLSGAQHFAVAFCRSCGSTMPRKDPVRGIAIIAMSALDDDPQRTVDRHIFIGSKASWYTAVDHLPKFDGPAS